MEKKGVGYDNSSIFPYLVDIVLKRTENSPHIIRGGKVKS